MAKWKVTATVQAKGNDPVDMVWQREGDQMGVIMSVSQLFAHDNQDSEENPFIYPELLAIKIERVG